MQLSLGETQRALDQNEVPVGAEETQSKILAGAIVENVTNFGGVLSKGAGQTPLTEFLRYDDRFGAGPGVLAGRQLVEV
jgi:hypothetical protein